MIAGVILIVWQGSERVIAGAMTVGAFVAYLELFLRFVNRGHRIPQLVNSLQSGGAAYARLRPLLAPALAVEGEPPRASFHAGHLAGATRPIVRAMTRRTGPASLSLRDVTFRYPGASAARPESRHSRRRPDRRHGPGRLGQECADTGDPRHLSAGVRHGAHR